MVLVRHTSFISVQTSVLRIIIVIITCVIIIFKAFRKKEKQFRNKYNS